MLLMEKQFSTPLEQCITAQNIKCVPWFAIFVQAIIKHVSKMDIQTRIEKLAILCLPP